MADEQTIIPVECVIKVDDQEITDLYSYLAQVSVDMRRNGATECRLEFDSIRTEEGVWAVQDSGWFAPWRRISVEAIFGDSSEEIMRGFIKEINVECPENMAQAKVTVSGQDESLALDREQVQRTWSTAEEPLSDGQIAERIASEYGLANDVEAGLSNASLSSNKTAIKLLQERAEANGFELFVRQGTLYFRPPQLEEEAQATIMVYAGRTTNCLSFSVKQDGHKPDQVRLTQQASDSTESEQEDFSPQLTELGTQAANSEQSGLVPFIWTMEQPNGATAEETRARAQAKADENAWKLVGEGELDGALYGHVLLTHKTVYVDGTGDTYGGLFYVDEVQHQFSQEGYRQKFKLLRNATGDDQSTSNDRLAAVR